MSELLGTPSDELGDVLATGGCPVTALWVSMSARHPEGDDLDYLEWHCTDHVPEQYRLPSLRGALRIVSTPACRAARIVSDDRYDATDHVMTYFFGALDGLGAFNDLGMALLGAGRIPYFLPSVERGVHGIDGVAAAPRVKVGADVLLWWPSTGVLLLVERGRAPAHSLTEVPGVGGVWWATGVAGHALSSAPDNAELQLTYCFLDDDPAVTAARMRPALEARWADAGVVPLFAAPFHTLVPWDPGRHLP